VELQSAAVLVAYVHDGNKPFHDRISDENLCAAVRGAYTDKRLRAVDVTDAPSVNAQLPSNGITDARNDDG
jgi:hypothetical protein